MLRILELESGNGKEPLLGSLLEASISSEENYETLSYRWEDIDRFHDPRQAAHLHLDSQVFPVSDSVLEALYVLRKPDQSRRLWIDQLCIVQPPHEPDKKSQEWRKKQSTEMDHQLRVMGNIYSNSARTVIWLGPNPTPEDILAKEYMTSFKAFRQQLGRLVDQHERYLKAANNREDTSFADDVSWKFILLTGLSLKDTQTLLEKGITEASRLPQLNNHQVECVLKFYQKTWFMRTW